MQDDADNALTTVHAPPVPEERFHQLIDAITDYAIFLLDARGYVATWNSGAQATKGYAADEILGRHFSLFYTAEDRAVGKPARVLDTVRKAGRFEDESWRVRKDGSLFWANVVITALRDEKGEITGFAKVTRDLSAQRQAAEQLHAAEERFHTLVDAVTDYAIFMLDVNGRVATWNAGAEHTKGYTADEIIGKHFSAFYTPEDRANNKPERALETVRRAGRFEDESWRVRKDGTRFWANVVITPLKNQRGELVAFAKVTRDLTSRRAAEENERKLGLETLARQAAEQERQRVLTLLEQVPAAVNFLRGPDLVFEFVHPSSPLEWDRPVPMGSALSTILPDDHRYVRGVRQAYETGRPQTQTEARVFQLVHGQPRERFWNAIYLPVHRAGSQQIEGVLSFELDVTDYVHARDALQAVSEENSRARTELENLNRAKDEFLATLSHELRTPLNAIYGWATLLRKRPLDYSKIERGLEVIERNARAQTRLVNDLLDVSRIISGKLQLRMRQTDLSPLIHEAADVVRPGAEAKGVRLVVDIDPEIGSTIADPDRLHQVLWNILINAVRFTERGGRITISADRSDSTFVIAVRDTGAGVDAAHLPHIFERFRQVDSSTTRAHGGLGLGLAIVRHLVEAHGGTVEAESAGLGHGTTFTLKLPVVPLAKASSPESNVVLAQAPAAERFLRDARLGLQGVTILVVDDDADSLEILREVLGKAEATIHTTSSASEALAMLAAHRVDVIISDIAMPGMDGYDFMRTVRASPRDRDTPAIALTAYARPEDAEKALTAGYEEHLAKPIDEAALISKAAALVALRGIALQS